MSPEQLPLWIEEPDEDLTVFEDLQEPRCKVCGIVLDDLTLVIIGFCSSECERENNAWGRFANHV